MAISHTNNSDHTNNMATKSLNLLMNVVSEEPRVEYI